MGREDEKREKMRRLEEKGRRRNQRGMIVILLVRNQWRRDEKPLLRSCHRTMSECTRDPFCFILLSFPALPAHHAMIPDFDNFISCSRTTHSDFTVELIQCGSQDTVIWLNICSCKRTLFSFLFQCCNLLSILWTWNFRRELIHSSSFFWSTDSPSSSLTGCIFATLSTSLKKWSLVFQQLNT